MCFSQECDWTAEISEHTEGPADTRTRCDECNGDIPAGAWRHTIVMVQWEECHARADDYGDVSDDDECPPDCQCDFGESFEYVRCEPCDKLLRAIEAAELEAGCRAWEARPMLLNLKDAIREEEHHGSSRYAAKALAMFPEVAEYLKKMME